MGDESGEFAMSGGGVMSGDEILLRTKFDLDTHEERYEYLSETVYEPVFAGESIDAVTEFVVPEQRGRYWGCFKVLRAKDPEFYCAFRYEFPWCPFPCLFAPSLFSWTVLILRRLMVVGLLHSLNRASRRIGKGRVRTMGIC